MGMKKNFSTAILGIFLFAGGFYIHAQMPADAVAEVPELASFHEVIFRIWHEAWPNKDTAMLKDLLPQVERGISQVASAKLPGILREKKDAWESGVSKLKESGAGYEAAVAAGDAARILDAAEDLHRRFETLMRLTRPALKELDDFHSSLYMLYHYYLPEYDIDKIRSSAEELSRKMQALNTATLPDRLQSKNLEFLQAREKLSESVTAFKESLRTNREETIKKAIDELHSNYQAVQSIF